MKNFKIEFKIVIYIVEKYIKILLTVPSLCFLSTSSALRVRAFAFLLPDSALFSRALIFRAAALGSDSEVEILDNFAAARVRYGLV